MRPIRSLLLAAALASLAFAVGPAPAQRAYPNAAMPRVTGSPMPMDPSWAFAFDPLLEDPMWSSLGTDPLLGRMAMPADPAEAARLAESMRQRMSELRRMGNPGAPFVGDPAWGDLSFDRAPLGYAGVGGPAAGSASAWSYSSETDEYGCARSRSATASSPGPAPSVVTRTEGHCTTAPMMRTDPQADDDFDIDVDEPDDEEPNGR
jgi:hypothetical protein